MARYEFIDAEKATLNSVHSGVGLSCGVAGVGGVVCDT
jgi:hypothetical protein